MTLLRALVYYAGFSVWTLLLGIVGLPVALFGRRAVVGLSRLWTGVTLRWLGVAVGLRYELRGRENLPAGPAVIALKHQSAWETLILNQLVPDPAIVFKRELFRLPLVGLYLHWTGMIAIDRKGGAGALRSMLAAAERAVADGRPIVIFPEGTRGPIGGKLPYQPGTGALYARLGVPMVPVALNSGLYWGRRALRKRKGLITIEILPPIPPGLDRRRAMALLEERIETATAGLIDAARAGGEAAGAPILHGEAGDA